MPNWMQIVAHLNPLTYAINAMRHLVINGWTTTVATDLAVLAVFAVSCLFIATTAFERHRV
jgi:ABC-2 type transport system permease protein